MMLRIEDLPDPDFPIKRTFFFWGFLRLFMSEIQKRQSRVRSLHWGLGVGGEGFLREDKRLFRGYGL